MILSSVQFVLGVFLFFGGTLFLSAQTTGSRVINLNLSEVALLDIEPNKNTVSFSLSAPTEAGRPVTISAVTPTKWLNYTSAIKATTAIRTVSAQIDGPIEGLFVKIQAAAASGNGGGALGTPTGKMTVTTSPIAIVSGIGGAFTGNGANNGHLLTISLELDDYKKLVKTTNKIITITYTISN
jgi:hypothetical protein